MYSTVTLDSISEDSLQSSSQQTGGSTALQAGFRPGLSCENCLFTVSMVIGKCKSMGNRFGWQRLTSRKLLAPQGMTAYGSRWKGKSPPSLHQSAVVECEQPSRSFKSESGPKQGAWAARHCPTRPWNESCEHCKPDGVKSNTQTR